MITGVGLILLLIFVSLLIGVMWRFDRVIEREDTDDVGEDGNENRIVTQIAAAQRLRREAEATADPEERGRLLRFADEADGTAEKIRKGIISDR